MSWTLISTGILLNFGRTGTPVSSSVLWTFPTAFSTYYVILTCGLYDATNMGLQGYNWLVGLSDLTGALIRTATSGPCLSMFAIGY